MNSIIEKARNIMNNPGHAPALIWRRISALRSYTFSRLLKHRASPPETVNLYPTDRCNLKCTMCFERLRKPRPELKLSDWQKIIDQIKKFQPRIHISGGEPFVYPDIGALISYIKKKNLFLVITTNGTFLERNAHDIVALQVNRIHVSIDGPEKVHDKIRGVPGTFQRIMSGLEKLKHLKGAHSKPQLRINSMINFNDPAAMQEVIRIGCHFDAQTVQFQHPFFVSQQGLASHKFYLKNENNYHLNYWEGADIAYGKPDDLNRAMEIIRDLQKEKSIKVQVFPEFTFEQLKEYYGSKGGLPEIYKGQCRAMWNTATILASGVMESCPDYILGDCKKDAFISIWNNNTMRKLRKRIRQGNFFPVCRGCCFFYD